MATNLFLLARNTPQVPTTLNAIDSALTEFKEN